MKSGIIRQILALILALMMIAGMLPAAFASDEAGYDVQGDAAAAQSVPEAGSGETKETSDKTEETETDSVTVYRAFDVSLQKDGEDLDVEGEFRVTVDTGLDVGSLVPEGAERTGVSFTLYHIHGDQVDIIEDAIVDENGILTFTTPNFSTFVLKYTVDFAFEAEDGTVYEFSIPGGGCISLYRLAEELGLAKDDPQTGEDEVQAFIDNIEDVTFSSPELVFIGKAEAYFTVGNIKEGVGLECQYSEELTEEDIDAINSQIIKPGDWAVISLQPFTSAETLTITMKDGKVYTVQVTDAQITKTFISSYGDAYDVTVTYNDDAQIPDNADLVVTEITKDSEEYLAARNSVIAQKQAEDINFDAEAYEMMAFDISIIDAYGNPVEPQAPVEVSIVAKNLPEEILEKDNRDSLEIQHLDESSGEVVVQTVASAAEGNLKVWEDNVQAEFTLESFSTFTVGWNTRNTNNNTTTLRWIDGNTARAYLTVSYVDENGNAITRPDGIGENQGNTVTFNNFVDGAQHTFTIENDLIRQIPNYTLKGAYVAGPEGTQLEVTSVNASRSGEVTTVTYYNGSNIVLTASFDATGQDNPRHNFTDDGLGLTIEYESNNHTTVHYGYMENGQFVEFTQQPDPTATSTADGWAYLLYDFQGTDGFGLPVTYNYVGTYYNQQEVTNPAVGTSVAPVLRYNENAWRYYATSHGFTGNDVNNNANWNGVANGSHLYVVYEKPDIENGGAPTLVDDDEIEPPDPPEILKQSEDNHDGTNTLSLSITGSATDIEVETLADVIVVLDLSSSMQNNIHNNSSTGNGYATNSDSRYYQAKQAVITLANNLYQKNTESGKDLIRMGLVTFAGNAQVRQELTEDRNTFLNTVNAISRYEAKGTNWEHALKLANEMSVDSGRATFVIFVTDGEPTASQTRFALSNSDLGNNIFMAGTNGGGFPNGYNHSVHNDRYDTLHFYLRSGTFGRTESGEQMNYTAAWDDAKSIVDHNKNFYVIAISEDVGVEALNDLLDNAGVPRSHGIPATNQTELTNAFSQIESEITGLLGWGDVQMEDGITDLTTMVEESDLVNVFEEFTYWKTAAPTGWNTWTAEQKDAYLKGIEDIGKTENPTDYDSWSQAQKDAYQIGKNVTFTEWSSTDMAAEGCAPAEYTNGAVQWNMGSSFMLEDGVTYKVSFICWPSQEAYDILAECRNDESFYDTLSNDEKSQIIRTGNPGNYTYTLKTNKPGANTSYKTATKTGNTVTTSGDPVTVKFGEVGPLHLDNREIYIKKNWVNEVDTRDYEKINLKVMADDVQFATIELRGDTDPAWQGLAYISTGLMKVTSTEQIIYETGHDFTLSEASVGDLSYHWEIESGIFRPMIITDPSKGLETAAKVLKKVEATDEYDYNIGGNYYKIQSDAENFLTATNYRRSSLNLTKNVVDRNGTTSLNEQFKDELFEFTFTVENSNAANSEVDAKIWFSIQDINENLVFDYETSATDRETRTVASAEYDPGTNTYTYVYDGKTYTLPAADGGAGGVMYTGYYSYPSGQSFTVKMKPTWNLRIMNLPTGTTYTITETSKTGFECIGAVSTADPPERYDTTFGYDSVTLSSSGTIEETNTTYTVTYTNKYILHDIVIIKTDDSSTPRNLEGATFQLYKKNNSEEYEKLGDEFEVPEDGYNYVGLTPGDYQLEEVVAPPGHILLHEKVLFTVTDDYNAVITLSADNNANAVVSGDSHDTLSIPNTPGIELPKTGGQGTELFTILGGMITAAAGAVLLRRRKRQTKNN